MIEFDHLGVTLDRCTDCDGLYFDSGELEAVLRAEFPESYEGNGESAASIEVVDATGDDDDTLTDGNAPRKRGFFRTLFRRNKKADAGEAPEPESETPVG